MKVGIRTPNLEKSFKARTTGKINRKVKSTVNPLYGKSGMGYINNPGKAVYNKVYHKTTRSFFDSLKGKNLLIQFFGLIIYLYYLLFKYVFYIPIKFLIDKIREKINNSKEKNEQ